MGNTLNPTLWRTTRALANPLRLSIIRELILRGEKCVCDVAAALGLQEGRASLELRALNARGMLSVKRQGRWVYYRLSANENIEGYSTLLDVLIETMRTRRLSDDEIIFLLTAFTNERRIILARLLADGPLELTEIIKHCDYSNASLGRHLRKLRRRGFVVSNKKNYALLKQSDPLAKVLLRMAVLSDV